MSVFAVLAAAVLFGTTGTAQALGPEGTTPLSVGAARLVLGGTVLGVLALGAARRQRHDHRRSAAASDLALMAVTAVAFVAYQPLFFLGTASNGVAVGTVVALGSAPVLAGLLEWALTHRPPAAVWMGATASATAGVVLLALGGASDDAAGSPQAGGILASIGAGASFALFAVAQRRLLERGWSSLTVVGAMGGGAAILSLPLLLSTDLRWVAQPGGIAVVLWLGLVSTALAYLLFTRGLQDLRAATAAALTLAEPLTAGILGVVVLGEHLAPLAIVGLVVLGVGLVVLAWGSRAPRDPKPFALEG